MIYFKIVIDNRIEVGMYDHEDTNEEEDLFLDLINTVSKSGGRVDRINEDEYKDLISEATYDEEEDIDLELELDKKYFMKLAVLEFYKSLKIDPTIEQLKKIEDFLSEK